MQVDVDTKNKDPARKGCATESAVTNYIKGVHGVEQWNSAGEPITI